MVIISFQGFIQSANEVSGVTEDFAGISGPLTVARLGLFGVQVVVSDSIMVSFCYKHGIRFHYLAR